MSEAVRVLVRMGDKNYGPYSVDELNSMVLAGRVRPDHLAWIEGAPEWQLLETVPGVHRAPPPLSSSRPSRPSPRARPSRPARSSAGAEDWESHRLILPAFLLAFFFGPLGLHRFYCGKVGSGIAMLLLSCTLIGLLVTLPWWLIDFVVIVCGGFRDDRGRVLTRWTE